MLKRIIPGHFRAYTFWMCLAFALVTYLVSESLRAVIGAELLLTGMFFGDQTIHLAQADHSAPAATTIERLMQRKQLLFLTTGAVLTAIGLRLLLSR